MHSRLINYRIFERDTIHSMHVVISIWPWGLTRTKTYEEFTLMSDPRSLLLKTHSASTIKEKNHEGTEFYFNMKN